MANDDPFDEDVIEEDDEDSDECTGDVVEFTRDICALIDSDIMYQGGSSFVCATSPGMYETTIVVNMPNGMMYTLTVERKK